jgi:DNA-binding XRE family transcriptional regulator
MKKNMKFNVVLEPQEEGGYTVYVPVLPGWVSQAETIASEGIQSLGKRIGAIRESIGITQSELAIAAKIGQVTHVRIENGEQSPRYETLAAIARALKRPIADLLAGGSPA